MNSNKILIEHFKDTFRFLHDSDLSQLRSIYANGVLFKNPVQEIRGLVALEDYFSSMCADLSNCRFEFLDESVTESSAYIKWMLHFNHPGLGIRLISVRGVSHLQLGDKIEFQEDFHDLAVMLDKQLPLLGNVTRWLRLRLAS